MEGQNFHYHQRVKKLFPSGGTNRGHMGGDNKSFLLLPTRGVLADESQNSQLSPAEEPSLMGVNGKPVGSLDLHLNLAEMRQPPLLPFLSRVTDTMKTEFK